MPANLRIVVEIPYMVRPFWAALPEQPWPDFVPLSSSASDDEIALVLYTLATYNSDQSREPLSPQALASAERLVLPGGVEASNESQRISPSCCSGAEDWVQWLYLIESGSAPWMGHGPTPSAERLEDGSCVIWPDEDRTGDSIHFDAASIEREVANLQSSLIGFHERLRRYLDAHAGEQAASVAEAFREHFRLDGPALYCLNSGSKAQTVLDASLAF